MSDLAATPFTAAGVPKLALSIEEVIEATAIGRTSIYEDIAAGKLRARKRGRSTIILTADLAEYLAALPLVETKQ